LPRRVLAHARAGVEAVEARHDHVEDDQIRMEAFELLDRLLAILRFDDLEPGLGDGRPQDHPGGRIVVGDEDQRGLTLHDRSYPDAGTFSASIADSSLAYSRWARPVHSQASSRDPRLAMASISLKSAARASAPIHALLDLRPCAILWTSSTAPRRTAAS